mgnify:CR=1 FL=1
MIDRERIRTTDRMATALDAVEAGIDAARPEHVLRDTVGVADGVLTIGDATYDLAAYDDVVVLGAGNAAGRIASHLAEALGPALSTGLVVTDDPAPAGPVAVVEGTHPVPSAARRDGRGRGREAARAADGDSVVVVGATGGGGALLGAPAEGSPRADLRDLTDALVRSGAPIDRINAVRKHVSAVKGGRLARTLAPATTVGIVFSDVTSDDPSVVASGPLSPDSTTYNDALTVLSEYGVDAPESVTQHLDRGVAGEVDETPRPGDPAFDDVSLHTLADNATAVAAAREVCAAQGFDPVVLSSSIRGDSQAAATTHVAVAEEIRRRGNPVEPPAAILSGGETTVAVGDGGAGGTGGPNQEFTLRAAVALPERTVCCAVDTDGLDGPTDAAGAIVDPDSVADPQRARDALTAHDAYSYLEECAALVHTGATGTNVNDLRVLLVPE